MIRQLTSEARRLFDKPDDGFEGLINDESYPTKWFAIRKIKGRPIPNVAAPAPMLQ